MTTWTFTSTEGRIAAQAEGSDDELSVTYAGADDLSLAQRALTTMVFAADANASTEDEVFAPLFERERELLVAITNMALDRVGKLK